MCAAKMEFTVFHNMPLQLYKLLLQSAHDDPVCNADAWQKAHQYKYAKESFVSNCANEDEDVFVCMITRVHLGRRVCLAHCQVGLDFKESKAHIDEYWKHDADLSSSALLKMALLLGSIILDICDVKTITLCAFDNGSGKLHRLYHKLGFRSSIDPDFQYSVCLDTDQKSLKLNKIRNVAHCEMKHVGNLDCLLSMIKTHKTNMSHQVQDQQK